MSVNLPSEINYNNGLSYLPPNTAPLNHVSPAINGSSFGESSQITFDLNKSNFLVPDSMYISYKMKLTKTVTNAQIPGTPAVTPFTRLEILQNSQVAQSIPFYGQIYNMLQNLQSNLSQKMSSVNLGYGGININVGLENQNGMTIIANANEQEFSFSFPLLSLLSSANKLVPLFMMPAIRLHLYTDTLANMFINTSNLVGFALTDVNLHYTTINFGSEIENDIRAMNQPFFIKSVGWGALTEELKSGSIGNIDLTYSMRYASVKSLFTIFGGDEVNLLYDSFDVTTSNGSYAYIINGQSYPSRAINTRANKSSAFMELKNAINTNGVHSSIFNMAISNLEWSRESDDATTCEIPAKFWLGVNTEKFSNNTSLTSGVSTRDGPISLRLQLNQATPVKHTCILIVMFDSLIEINPSDQTMRVVT